MIYRRLDDNGDYSFGQNRQDFVADVDAVAQAIYTRLFLLFGEWWEDQKDGLPLWQSIIGVPGSPNNKRAADLLIQERITGTPNVTGLESFSSNFDSTTRQYSFYCVVNTAFGKISVTTNQGQLVAKGVTL